MIERYRGRISGPLLDRIDLHAQVPAVTLGGLKGPGGESTEAVAARVLAAPEIQRRLRGGSAHRGVKGAMTDTESRRHCRLEAGAQRLLDSAFEKLGLSARALTRILKALARSPTSLARTASPPHRSPRRFSIGLSIGGPVADGASC